MPENIKEYVIWLKNKQILKKLSTLFIRKKIKRTRITEANLSQSEHQSNLLLYRSINEMPMYNFRQIINTGDTRYLYKLENYYDLPQEYPDPEKWDDIFWEYIEAKGLDQKFRLRLELKAKLVVLENEQIFQGKKNQTKISIVQLKLDELKKGAIKSNDLENDAILSKYLGFVINPMTTTVSQYIGFEKLLKESNKNGKNNRQRTLSR